MLKIDEGSLRAAFFFGRLIPLSSCSGMIAKSIIQTAQRENKFFFLDF